VHNTSRRAIRAEHRIAELTAAIWRLAEHTGAPAADLVERIEADARGADRTKASAAAQAAGAQATALLLAALPLGGIALGYGIGADPLQVLLHTPLGAGCAAIAVLLQSAGLLWADRLANGPTR
jgi:tight adherence protein B